MTFMAQFAVGDRMPPVSATITQDMINTFAEISRDYNPIHVDPEFARTTPFGGTIAHGVSVAGLLFRSARSFLGGAWPYNNSRMSITFLAPTRPGDRVTATGEVKEVRDDGLVVCEAFCEKDDGTKVMVCTLQGYVSPLA